MSAYLRITATTDISPLPHTKVQNFRKNQSLKVHFVENVFALNTVFWRGSCMSQNLIFIEII